MGIMISILAKREQYSASSDEAKNDNDLDPTSDLEPYNPTLADTGLVRAYLMNSLRQPAELADYILDYAGYAPRLLAAIPGRFVASAAMIVTRQYETRLTQEQSVALGKLTGVDKTSISTTYEGPRNSVAALCLVTGPLPGGRWAGEDVVAKKVRFWMRTRDQGWGGTPVLRATYRGSFSWLEAVIIRPIPSLSDPSSLALLDDNQDSSPHPPPSKVPKRDHIFDSELQKIQIPSPQYPDPSTFEAHFLNPRGYQLVPCNRYSRKSKGKRKRSEERDHIEEEEEEEEEEAGKDVKKTWTLQHNLVAVAQAREHIVEWWNDKENSRKQGRLIDDKAKKDAKRRVSSNSEGSGNIQDNDDNKHDQDDDDDSDDDDDDDDNDKDEETGKGDGKGFVKALRPGDRVGVLARALYPGWSITVENLEIELDTLVRY